MAYSKIQIPGNGTNGPFVVSFALGYLSQSEVTARVNAEVDGLGAPVYRTITWLDVELVNISGTAPTALDTITFERTVSKTVLKHDFADGAPIIERNLDESHKQAIMVAQEALDGRFGALQGDLDVGNHKIINVLDPVNPQDAATKAYIDLQVISAGNVPAPTAPDVNKVLTATGVGTYAWGSPVTVPDATDTVAGKVEYTSDVEADAGVIGSRVMSLVQIVARYARLAAVNTFTAMQTIVGSATVLLLHGNAVNASHGGSVELRRSRNGAALSANDGLSTILWNGVNSVGAVHNLAYITANCLDPIDGSEDAEMLLSTHVAGSETIPLKLANGVQIGAAPGGYKGLGTLNVQSGVYYAGQPVGGGLAIFNYETASGTNAAASVADTWTTGPMNAQILNNIGASLGANQITLVAGTYRVRGFKTSYASGYTTWRLQNITDGTTICRAGVFDAATSGLNGPAVLSEFEFTIAGTKVVAQQYYSDTAQAAGQGNATGNPAGVNNVWAQLVFEKIA